MTTIEAYKWLMEWYNERKADLQSQPALVAAIKADARVENTVRVLYQQLFTKILSGCGSCLADGFAEIRHVTEDQINAIMECKFKLKDGVVLFSNKLRPATNANLTDELAIAYIRENNARVAMFVTLPDNLDELLAEKPANQKKSGSKTKTTKKNK